MKRRGSTYFTPGSPGVLVERNFIIDIYAIDRMTARSVFQSTKPSYLQIDDWVVQCLHDYNPNLFPDITQFEKPYNMQHDLRNLYYAGSKDFFRVPSGVRGTAKVNNFYKSTSFAGNTPLFTSEPIITTGSNFYRFLGVSDSYYYGGSWAGITIGSGQQYSYAGIYIPSQYHLDTFTGNGYFWYFKVTVRDITGGGSKQQGKVNGIYIG